MHGDIGLNSELVDSQRGARVPRFSLPVAAHWVPDPGSWFQIPRLLGTIFGAMPNSSRPSDQLTEADAEVQNSIGFSRSGQYLLSNFDSK